MKREFPEIQSAKDHGRVVSTVRAPTTRRRRDACHGSGHCGVFRGRSGLLKALLGRLLGPHKRPAVADTTKGAVCLLEYPRMRLHTSGSHLFQDD